MSRPGIKGTSYKGIFKTTFNKLKKQAYKRKLAFSITMEYIGDLFEKQKKKCALTGELLTLKKTVKDQTQTASLDRKNSSMGYIEGNVQWVHKDINRMKSNFSEERFVNSCQKIVEHNKHKSKVNKIKKIIELLNKIKS